jgi:hypothetical protein
MHFPIGFVKNTYGACQPAMVSGGKEAQKAAMDNHAAW